MRQIKYLLILVASALIFQACEEEKIATFSESFVYFDTKSGAATTLTVIEGQSIVVDIVSSAPSFGADNTITFTVTPPVTEYPESAEYEIWDMNGNVLSAPYTVTVEKGVGIGSFKFHPVDNDIYDGTREFTLTIQSNTSGFTNGVSEISKEAISIKIQVRDDDHPLERFVGERKLVSAYPGDVTNVTVMGGEEADELLIYLPIPMLGITIDMTITVDEVAGTAEWNYRYVDAIDYGPNYGEFLIGWEDNDIVYELPVPGVILPNDTDIQFDGWLSAVFTPGGPNEGLFCYYALDLLLTD
ncbi:MAG: hypothetical protein LUF87_11690 [Alistipes sp.]|nr:hypothetical protein [Alistipes sp.]